MVRRTIGRGGDRLELRERNTSVSRFSDGWHIGMWERKPYVKTLRGAERNFCPPSGVCFFFF